MRRIPAVLTSLTFACLSIVLLQATNEQTASAAAVAPSQLTTPSGYWTVGADGSVNTFGNAAFHGSMSGQRLNAPVIDLSLTRDGSGYWLTGADGGVFTYGAAQFYGSTGGMKLNAPVVTMSATPDNGGYWFAARDGGVFAYGDAPFRGSAGSIKLNKPIVGMTPTPSGNGYWLVASDGGVFAYGDAPFLGSAGSIKLNKPIVSMTATESGRGYWLVASDGGVFTYGDAAFYGSTGAINLNKPIVDIARTPSGGGYWLVASDGGVFSYGDAPFFGSSANKSSAQTVAVAVTPRKRTTAETSIFYYPWYSSAPHDGSWRHWDQGGSTPPDYIGADYWPSRGPYSSADTAVTSAQMAEIKSAGIDTVIISWWGRGSWEDSTLPSLMSAAKANGLKVAIHVEPYPNRAATLTSDYAYLTGLGVTDLYIYNADGLGQSTLRTANDSLPTNVRVFAQAGSLSTMKTGAFQAWAANASVTGIYTYAGFGFSGADFGAVCDRAHSLHMICAPSVAPGFTGQRATSIKTVVDRKAGATYDSQWTGALIAGADVVSITSYNEWHEGTQIEPSVPHCLPDGTCLQNYSGAYGAAGDGSNAYLQRTAYWTALYKARP